MPIWKMNFCSKVLRVSGFFFLSLLKRKRVIRRQMVMIYVYLISNARCVASYMARMGQCFSTSIDTVGIEISQGSFHFEVDDVKTADQKYCFSDGVGKISRELVNEVCMIYVVPHEMLLWHTNR